MRATTPICLRVVERCQQAVHCMAAEECGTCILTEGGEGRDGGEPRYAGEERVGEQASLHARGEVGAVDRQLRYFGGGGNVAWTIWETSADCNAGAMHASRDPHHSRPRR